MITFEGNALQVEAALVADGLGVTTSLLHKQMIEGRVTSLFERGIDEDAGRSRLTFFSESCRFRLVFDEAGQILKRSTINFRGRQLPRGLHR